MSTTQTSTVTTPVIQEGSKTTISANKINNNTTKKETPKNFGLVGLPILLPVTHLLILYKREIPFWDCFFSIAFPLYLYLANRFRFDSNSRQIALRESLGESYPDKPHHTKVSSESWFPKYMQFAATLGVFLPIATQVLAPEPIAQATAPHLYVLVCQILMEMMTRRPDFHPLLQLMVPLGFSAYRMSCLKSWVVTAWQMSGGRTMATTATTLEILHLVLAVSNAIFWSYNTFIMLPLRLVPQCMDQNGFPDASNVTWKYMLPSVDSTEDIFKSH